MRDVPGTKYIAERFGDSGDKYFRVCFRVGEARQHDLHNLDSRHFWVRDYRNEQDCLNAAIAWRNMRIEDNPHWQKKDNQPPWLIILAEKMRLSADLVGVKHYEDRRKIGQKRWQYFAVHERMLKQGKPYYKKHIFSYDCNNLRDRKRAFHAACYYYRKLNQKDEK